MNDETFPAIEGPVGGSLGYLEEVDREDRGDIERDAEGWQDEDIESFHAG